jgi:hypothetical protein
MPVERRHLNFESMPPKPLRSAAHGRAVLTRRSILGGRSRHRIRPVGRKRRMHMLRLRLRSRSARRTIVAESIATGVAGLARRRAPGDRYASCRRSQSRPWAAASPAASSTDPVPTAAPPTTITPLSTGMSTFPKRWLDTRRRRNARAKMMRPANASLPPIFTGVAPRSVARAGRRSAPWRAHQPASTHRRPPI